MKEVLLPELGDGIEKAVLACWHKKLGDQISSEDDIAEVVTDKATFNVPAGTHGILKKVLVDEGQEAFVGKPIALIEIK